MKNSISKNIARDFVAFYATKSQITLAASILGIGIVSVNPAQAASLVNGSGISNPGTTITFDEIPLANGIALTNQYSSLGVTFTGLFYNPFPNPFPNINPPSAGNFPDGLFNSINPFVISFAQSQSAAAFSLATGFPGTSTFEALLNGTVVDSFSSATDFQIANNFYGFTGVTFDAIRVDVTNAGGAALIDNIQFSFAATAVPEPFTIIGTLVGGTAAVRMKKKLKSANKA